MATKLRNEANLIATHDQQEHQLVKRALDHIGLFERRVLV